MSDIVTARTRATRAKLLRVARAVFEADGYDGASVSRIVDDAEVSRGTFYLYFDSKEAVFRTLVEELNDEILRAQESETDISPQELIRFSTRRFLEFYRENARLMAVLEQAATHAPEFRTLRLDMRRGTVRRAERLIRKLQQAGAASPTIEPRYAAHALNGMIDRFAFFWFVLDEHFEMDQAVATLSELWIRSIGSPFVAADDQRSTPA